MNPADEIDLFYGRVNDMINAAVANIAGDVGTLYNFLLVLTIVWTGIMWALSENAITPLVLRRVIFISIFLFLINNWVEVLNMLGGSFQYMGIKAGGMPVERATEFIEKPSLILSQGFMVADPIYVHSEKLADGIGWTGGWSNLPTVLLLLLAYLCLIAVYAILTIVVLINLIVFKVGGVIVFVMLPFAMFSKTAFLAERPIAWVFAAGLKLMVYGMTLGLAMAFVRESFDSSATVDIRLAISTLVVSLLVGLFVLFTGRIAGDLAAGSASLGLSDISYARMAGGASVRATSAPVTAGRAVAQGGSKAALAAAGAVKTGVAAVAALKTGGLSAVPGMIAVDGSLTQAAKRRLGQGVSTALHKTAHGHRWRAHQRAAQQRQRQQQSRRSA